MIIIILYAQALPKCTYDLTFVAICHEPFKKFAYESCCILFIYWLRTGTDATKGYKMQTLTKHSLNTK